MMVSLLGTVASLIVYSGRSRIRRCSSVSPYRLYSQVSNQHHADLQSRFGRISYSSSDKEEQTWLVVGDGDLSYSSVIAEDLAMTNTRLIATVLEAKEDHNRVYERSLGNTATIENFPSHEVMFGVDGTDLESTFPDTSFDCIDFNFPHWRGKTNARYNRRLLDGFLRSASAVLKRDGEIRIALCEGQGGMPCESLEEWRRSWMAAMYASEHGLMLRELQQPFFPNYGLSSKSGKDRPFFVGESPQRYIFTFPNGQPIDVDLQISCRHEFRIVLDPKRLESSPKSFDDIAYGNDVLELASEFIPDGIRFQIEARDVLPPLDWNGGHDSLAVFLFNYSGERIPLKRLEADKIRANIEAAVVERWNLDISKGGRLVSRPYPHFLLPKLIKQHKR